MVRLRDMISFAKSHGLGNNNIVINGTDLQSLFRAPAGQLYPLPLRGWLKLHD